MEPPRRPRPTDMAKRKQELEETHKADPVTPNMSAEELKEADNAFKDF